MTYGRHLKKVDLDHFHLVPSLRITEQRDDQTEWTQTVESPAPLVIDLAPVIDDGKHWILRANRQVERVEIDPQLAEKHGLKITPQGPSHLARVNKGKATRSYHILARYAGNPARLPESVPLVAVEFYSGKTLAVTWPLAEARSSDAPVAAWAEQRLWNLQSDFSLGAPVIGHWTRAMGRQYQLPGGIPRLFSGGGAGVRGRPETTRAMGMLGGRAAIDETLQLQDLRLSNNNEKNREPTIAIADIEGVTVGGASFRRNARWLRWHSP